MSNNKPTYDKALADLVDAVHTAVGFYSYESATKIAKELKKRGYVKVEATK